MATGPLRMVCFDAGGVLVRICRTWREGCEAAGVEYRWNDAAGTADETRRILTEDYQRGRIECPEFFRRMAETTSGLYSAPEFQRVHGAWMLGEYPGASELVRELNRAGHVETGLLSNTSASHWAQPHMIGGRGSSAVGLVKHPHASHLLGLTKPGLEIYRAFERETTTAPESILFFDDLEENVLAARSAGWRAEQVDFRGDTCSQIRRYLRAHGVMP
jgi:glucose-1-phosphatase